MKGGKLQVVCMWGGILSPDHFIKGRESHIARGLLCTSWNKKMALRAQHVAVPQSAGGCATAHQVPVPSHQLKNPLAFST